jgi:hypothetical protein
MTGPHNERDRCGEFDRPVTHPNYDEGDSRLAHNMRRTALEGTSQNRRSRTRSNLPLWDGALLYSFRIDRRTGKNPWAWIRVLSDHISGIPTQIQGRHPAFTSSPCLGSQHLSLPWSMSQVQPYPGRIEPLPSSSQNQPVLRPHRVSFRVLS